MKEKEVCYKRSQKRNDRALKQQYWEKNVTRIVTAAAKEAEI